MRYIHSLHTHITPVITAYIETLEEAFADINDFLDAQLESDNITHLVIAGIVLTPIIGAVVFLGVVVLSV